MAIAPLPDTTTATDQLHDFHPNGDDDWGWISRPLAEQFYPAVMDELTALSDEPALPVHLGYIIGTLHGSPPINGSPATVIEYAQRYDDAASIVGLLVDRLRYERRALGSAWQGETGHELQKSMASVTFDAELTANLLALGAKTLLRFAAALDHAQQLDIHPRATLSDAWTAVQALPRDAGLGDAGVEAAQSAAESGCAGMTLARVATVDALLAARNSLRSRRPPEQRDTASTDNADTELARTLPPGVLFFDQEQVDASTRSLEGDLGVLYALSTKWSRDYRTVDSTGLGEVAPDLAQFQFAGVDALAWTTTRVRGLAFQLVPVGVDLTGADEIASQLVSRWDANSDLGKTGHPVRTLPGGSSTPGTPEPPQIEFAQSATGITADAADTETTTPDRVISPIRLEPLSRPEPGNHPAPAQSVPVSPRTGSRRDPDDAARTSDRSTAEASNPNTPSTGISIDPETLRHLADQHTVAAQTLTGVASALTSQDATGSR